MMAVSDASRGPALFAVTLITYMVALSTCALRFYERVRVSRRIGWDDFHAGLAAIFGLVATVFILTESNCMSNSICALEADWLSQAWLATSVMSAKISICHFFMRLSNGFRPWHMVMFSQILPMTALNCVYAFAFALQCRPVEKLWNSSVPGQCWSIDVQLAIYYVQGATSVFWWLFLALFPVVIAYEFEAYPNMRLSVNLMSLLCVMAAVFATVRTYERSLVVPDFYTFDNFFGTMLTVLEQNIGIVASNILAIGFLLPNHPFRGRRSHAHDPENHPGVGTHRHDNDALELQVGTPQDHAYQTETSKSSSSRRSSILIIEGPRLRNKDNTAKTFTSDVTDDTVPLTGVATPGSSGSLPGSRPSSADGGSSLSQPAVPEPIWPRGIIKTVEVEVVAEDIADMEHPQQPPPVVIHSGGGVSGFLNTLGLSHSHGGYQDNLDGNGTRHSFLGTDNDWGALLRSGASTPPPATRTPSRQG